VWLVSEIPEDGVWRAAAACQKSESDVKQLLAVCELPYEDITPAHLRHFLTVQGGSQLAGVVGLEFSGDVGLLRSLAVIEQYRGSGIGSQLVNDAEEYARSQGVKTLYLLTTTAEVFFAKRGYKQTDRKRAPRELQETAEFKNLCPASAVCMAKTL
jgi:amino-acid N-acetyltransferase